MKTFIAIVSLSLSTSPLWSQSSFRAYGTTVLYSNPDSTKWLVDRAAMDPDTKKYVLMLKHVPVQDDEGRKIEPVIAVLCEAVPDSSDIIAYSVSKRLQVPFTVKKVLTYDDGHFTYEYAIGYEGEYERGGVVHRLLVAHMLHREAGIQIICDSTDGVYQQVESDMRSFLRSVDLR